jgi:hypothetical protein
MSWSDGERGYFRWELSESPGFASGVSQTTRRDFGPMSGGGGPVTLDERVRSSSCAGVSGNCSVLASLRPGTRYYVRICGELFAPSSTGYRCFDSDSDPDPPYKYDFFDTDTRLTSAPDVTSQSPGTLDVFVRGTNDELLQNHHDYRTGSWSGWQRPLTGSFGDDSMTSAPGSASFGSSLGFDVVARGVDNVLYHSKIRVGEQHALSRLTGSVTSGPDAAAGQRLDVVACGPNNALQQWQAFNLDTPAWYGPRTLTAGGRCTADPSVVAYRNSWRVDIFSRGADGWVYHTYCSCPEPSRPDWSGLPPIPGVGTSGVDAAASGSGPLQPVHLFARGQNNELLYNRHDGAWPGTWSGWQSLGGDLTSDPTAISAEPGRVDVFARCAEDALHHWAFWQGVWQRSDLGDCSTNVFEGEGPDEILDDDPEDPEVDPDPAVGASLTASQPLRLADQRETQAMAVLEGDQRAQKLLATTKYSIDKIGPWSEPAADGSQRLVGATLILDLTKAQDWPLTDWPQVGYLPKSKEYLESTHTFAMAGATEILVDIDLTKGRVVGMSPLGGIVTKRAAGDRSMKPSPWRGD